MIELPGYPWVTLEGRATWSTGNPSLVTLPQSTQKRLEFLKIGVNGSAGILCKILQVIITSGKLKNYSKKDQTGTGPATSPCSWSIHGARRGPGRSGDTCISKSTINCTVTESCHCTVGFCLTACSVLTDWIGKVGY